MFLAALPADMFATNCYVVAVNAGEQCIVIDPGIGVLDRLDALLADHQLHPAAVVLTHGHLDHTFSVAPVCGARGITAYLHPGDNELIRDPEKALSIDVGRLLGGRLAYTQPEDIATLKDGEVMTLAGLELTVAHAPGHTPGSVLLHVPGEEAPLCFTGDVLFAGSIGRCDLPGGDPQAMRTSLASRIAPLPDDTIVMPGHGPATTIGRERATNPFLLDLTASSGRTPTGGWS